MRHSLLQRLQSETASLHEALETSLNLLRPEMTLEEYRTLLEGFYGFYAPWEASVADRIDQLLPRFTKERSKAPLLERDLLFLRCDLKAIPKCLALPDTNSFPALLCAHCGFRYRDVPAPRALVKPRIPTGRTVPLVKTRRELGKHPRNQQKSPDPTSRLDPGSY